MASTTPDQWQQRVLLIFVQKKTDHPAMMGNFRPVGLLEVLRTVGTKMVTRCILPLLETRSVLQPNQFAFLPGRDTSSKLIQFINVLEEVAENDLPVDLTTGDVRGTFDSPERTAQWASWCRIGLFTPLATYLTNLGALSTYRLTSFYKMRQNMDPTLEGVDPITDSLWFCTRGGTQDDPLSTLGRVVFFDILLTALNKVQRAFPFFYFRYHGSRLEPHLSACYANDLYLVSSSGKASNCIILAFAAMFGIEFAPVKLWAITIISSPGEVVLYSRGVDSDCGPLRRCQVVHYYYPRI
jgi:hypothetical protein